MTRDQVLSILKRNIGGYVSGEEISRDLGITRAAVHSAVQRLRQDGYEISSATNRGYQLLVSPDKLSCGDVLSWLPDDWKIPVYCLEEVDSTNDYLKKIARQHSTESVFVLANRQSAGKGRMGRSFLSPKDKGIYLSFLLHPDCDPAEIIHITAWTAVAISEAIQKVTGISTDIKWVNDLVKNGKKLCGILTEMSVEAESMRVQYVIIGIGINVNHQQNDFSLDLQDIASSLLISSGKTFDRSQLAAAVIEKLVKLQQDWPNRKMDYLASYRKRCKMLGSQIRLLHLGTEETATAIDIDDNFGLVVQFADGHTETVTSGEVSVRGIYGYQD